MQHTGTYCEGKPLSRASSVPEPTRSIPARSVIKSVDTESLLTRRTSEHTSCSVVWAMTARPDIILWSLVPRGRPGREGMLAYSLLSLKHRAVSLKGYYKSSLPGQRSAQSVAIGACERRAAPLWRAASWDGTDLPEASPSSSPARGPRVAGMRRPLKTHRSELPPASRFFCPCCSGVLDLRLYSYQRLFPSCHTVSMMRMIPRPSVSCLA